MENQDTIFEQFKNAAEKAETKDFPEMEKIWSRVDAKLDTVVYKKQNNSWKKLAVAASVVLVGIIIFQYLKTDSTIILPKNEMVVSDTINSLLPKVNQQKNVIVSIEEKNTINKTDAEKIIKKQIETETKLAVLEEKIADYDMVKDLEENHQAVKENNSSNEPLEKKSENEVQRPVFEARVVQSAPQIAESNYAKSEDQYKRSNDLLVVDGKLSKNTAKSKKAALSEIDNNELETIVHLKEPLYIINGTYYDEESLFGKNPTSPYAPLDQQEIKTIKILQDQEAIAVYGEKGKKGVVIITTKTGKPKKS